MNFKTVVKTSYSNIPVEEYFNGTCTKCGFLVLKIRSSYKRIICDLGAPRALDLIFNQYPTKFPKFKYFNGLMVKKLLRLIIVSINFIN